PHGDPTRTRKTSPRGPGLERPREARRNEGSPRESREEGRAGSNLSRGALLGETHALGEDSHDLSFAQRAQGLAQSTRITPPLPGGNVSHPRIDPAGRAPLEAPLRNQEREGARARRAENDRIQPGNVVRCEDRGPRAR